MPSWAATKEPNHDIALSAHGSHKHTTSPVSKTTGIVNSAPLLVTGKRRYERCGGMISRRPRFDAGFATTALGFVAISISVSTWFAPKCRHSTYRLGRIKGALRNEHVARIDV